MLSWYGVTQGDLLLMELYGIIFIPLEKVLWAANPGILTPFYADDVEFDGPARRISRILKLLLERGEYQRYFPKMDKSLFISDTP